MVKENCFISQHIESAAASLSGVKENLGGGGDGQDLQTINSGGVIRLLNRQ